MIDFAGVSYHYPNQAVPALRDVTLQTPTGSFLLLVGPSGAGKSTLLRCLNGLVPHFYGGTLAGRLSVDGRDPVAMGPRGMSDLVGFVFQDPESQFVTQLVEDELAFAMENHNFEQSLMRRRVEEVLDQLSIADLRGRRVDTLSGGQRQLVAIASVLTLQPSILVLDEPTSQLDPQAAEEVLTILQRLNQDLGLTIVLSEHRLERVAQYADQICYLPGAGRPPILGDPRTILPQVDLVPPLVELGRQLGWQPLPLTIKEGRPFGERLKARLSDAPTGKVPAPAATAPRPGSGDGSVGSDGVGIKGSVPRRAATGATFGPRRDWQPMPGATPALAVQDVWFRYNDRDVLKGVSLEVRRGEFVALMGRNGAGKSTLLKSIVGLLRPQRGRVRAQGMAVEAAEITELTRTIGFVPQNPGRLLFSDTLEQELAFTCRAHGLSQAGIGPLLARLGMSDLSQAYPRDLSAGERQRAALASILVAEPGLLLLDEPTRGLDYASKERLAGILADLCASGVTIIMATHDVELVAQCARRVIILGDGQVVVDGPVRSVMTGSLVFASQINKLLRDDRFLTVGDVLAQLQVVQSGAHG
jgi:energy-coupling factor transport system ATP-binding protein